MHPTSLHQRIGFISLELELARVSLLLFGEQKACSLLYQQTSELVGHDELKESKSQMECKLARIPLFQP